MPPNVNNNSNTPNLPMPFNGPLGQSSTGPSDPQAEMLAMFQAMAKRIMLENPTRITKTQMPKEWSMLDKAAIRNIVKIQKRLKKQEREVPNASEIRF
jgi:hypothetical protein